MDPRNWRMLEAKMRHRIPTRVEEHEHGTNVMVPRNGQELFNAVLKANGVSLSQSRSWRKTRIVFMPIASAQPISLSISGGSKVSFCHISSWLIADLGM